jgi:hypothetical protein
MPATTPLDPAPDAPLLSIILPFYRKLAEFREVLPLNLPHFARPGREVILALDENSESDAVVALVRRYPEVRWKVLVNDVPHRWRPPCKAINVGLRHASGRSGFIASPESAYAGDAPGLAVAIAGAYPAGIALGRVGFTQFDNLRDGRTIDAHCTGTIPHQLFLDSFYGSICGPRAAFEAVDGYAEAFTDWGGDDDNVRIRLEMAGYTLLACPGVRVLHLSFKPRAGPQHPDMPWDEQAARVKCSPDSIRGTRHADWGRSFDRIAYASEALAVQAAVDVGPAPAGIASLPAGACMPIRSARRCRLCGRRVFHERAQKPCPGCQPAAGRSMPRPGDHAPTMQRPGDAAHV